VRGELVLVLEGAPAAPGPDDEQVRRAMDLERLAGQSLRDAASSVAAALGVPRRRAYEVGLSLWNAGR
jgi:16S rRNA (cytidine1402-2'-O)-methyltransferase